MRPPFISLPDQQQALSSTVRMPVYLQSNFGITDIRLSCNWSLERLLFRRFPLLRTNFVNTFDNRDIGCVAVGLEGNAGSFQAGLEAAGPLQAVLGGDPQDQRR
jgi:hypothetical protein